MAPADDTRVRKAREGELPAVMGVLDGANLAIDAETVADRLEEDVLVAVEGDRVLGACVLTPEARGAHVEAVAVRRRRRGQGIGSALLEAATERRGRLTAEFDAADRPFYESLGFDVTAVAGEPGRFRGVSERD